MKITKQQGDRMSKHKTDQQSLSGTTQQTTGAMMLSTGQTSDTSTIQTTKQPRRSPRKASQLNDSAVEKFSGFRIELNRDVIGKKKLGNNLSIVVPDTRTETTVRLTFREAKALRAFLVKNLPE